MSMISHKFVAYVFKTPPNIQTQVDKERQTGVFVYPFNTVIYWNVPDAFIPLLTNSEKIDEFTVEVDEKHSSRVEANRLLLNRLTVDRVHVLAQILAQSVTLEHLELQVDGLLTEVSKCASGPSFKKTTIKYIRQTIAARNNIIGDLRLLDKPILLWEDTIMDSLYNDLRNMFDLSDRFKSIEYKLSTIQETLSLLIGLTNHKRSYILEVLVVLLIAFEIVLSFIHR